MINFDLDHVTG